MENLIYVSSDTHFCHDREFLWGPRGYKSVDEMNEDIVRKWNDVVRPEDTVYLLGDCMLNDNDKGLEYMRRLNGKLYICLGNHDTEARKALYLGLPQVQDVQLAYLIKCGKQSYYLSHYPTITSNYDVDKPLGQRVINVCGHTHTQDRFKDMDKGLIFHAELDANDCYPFLLSDIKYDILNYLQRKEDAK